MPPENSEYHGRREREHRTLASAAATDEVRRVHLEFAEHYAAKLKAGSRSG